MCVEAAGLIVRPDFPWLGASPDGIVPLDNGLVEVKCPFVCRDTSFADAAKTSTFCLKSTSEGLCLRCKLAYHYQIITQLFVTKAAYCDLVVWSPKDLHVERIFPDPDFSLHAAKLKEFYFQFMLPHVVRSRP